MDNPPVLDAIFIGPTTSTVTEALQAGGAPTGAVAVIGPVRLGRALADRGYEVVQIVDKPRARSGAIARQLLASPASLPLGDGELVAVVARGTGMRPDWESLFAEWSRVLRDRGVLVLVDRAPATEIARRALCGGLTEIEQRRTGRKVVTSGCITKI